MTRQAVGHDIDLTEAKVAEVTADLQRVHAEYANYRKRVERDRELVRETAVAATLGRAAAGAGRHRARP